MEFCTSKSGWEFLKYSIMININLESKSKTEIWDWQMESQILCTINIAYKFMEYLQRSEKR